MLSVNFEADWRQLGLRGPLFANGIAQGEELLLTETQRELMHRVSFTLSAPGSAVVVTGFPGVGKTTVAYAAAGRGPDRSGQLLWLGPRPASAEELLYALLHESGVKTTSRSQAVRAQAWRRFALDQVMAGEPPVVLVENVQSWDPLTLRHLHDLTSPEADGVAGVSLLLTGTAALTELLQHAELIALCQRIYCTASLEPAAAEELAELMFWQAELAGAVPTELFAPGTLELIHSYAGGIIRVAQALCVAAMRIAVSRHEPNLRPATVRDTALQMLPLQISGRGPQPATALGPISNLQPTAGDIPTLTDRVDEAAA